MERAQDKTILVVDDEPNIRQYLKMVLEDAGFNVTTAGDGEEALEMIRDGRIEDAKTMIALMMLKQKLGR